MKNWEITLSMCIPIPFISTFNVLFHWLMGPQPHVWTVALHACYHCYMLVCDCCLWLPIWQENSHNNNNNSNVHLCHFTCCLGVGILTALDINSASGVVLSQWVLHHTCVIPRILQFCSADLDSGVFPVGDNAHTAESGESWQGGNSMETQQVETWGVERQTTGQTAAWQQHFALTGIHAHLIWGQIWGRKLCTFLLFIFL